MINRSILPHIKSWLDKHKVIIIYGARQVGKTTLSKALIQDQGEENCTYLSCERVSVRETLESQNLEEIIKSFQGKKFVVLDEAQLVNDIGRILKIIHDEHPDIQLVATGSSSFDLNNKLNEPLTGRNAKYVLYPFSIKELSQNLQYSEIRDKLNNILRFGTYPDVYDKPELESIEKLDFLSGDYLYKDLLALDNIKKPALLKNLLKALALQLGNEVNFHEIAKLLGTSSETVERYIDLLEKSFVIFRLYSFSRNLRNELKRGFKVYFYDLGIRNGIISDYKKVENRSDIGGLFENFCVLERLKQIQANREHGNLYFWRSYLPDKEIDFIEERDGKLYTYEFKWNPKASGNARLPKNFLESYGGGLDENGNSKNIEFKVVDSDNWWNWLT
jgi:uncharacterized protein